MTTTDEPRILSMDPDECYDEVSTTDGRAVVFFDYAGVIRLLITNGDMTTIHPIGRVLLNEVEDIEYASLGEPSEALAVRHVQHSVEPLLG